MDYKSILLKIIFSFSLLTLLTACGGPNEEVTVGSIKVSPEPLRIIGRPFNKLYYDSFFEAEFGASGGDGQYRYRYIQNPLSLDGEPINESENPVEMTIEVLDSAKPGFVLKALPTTLPEDVSFDALNDRTYTYRLELTDGKNTITRDFEFTLSKNTLKFTKLSAAVESSVTNTPAVAMLSQKQFGNTRICNQILEQTFEKRTTDKGETVYPFVFQVFTDAPVASRTELFYRLTSLYNANETERSERNIGFLRPEVDYIDKVRSIVLEPGESTCVGFVEYLDDTFIEGEEEVRIDFFSTTGGAVDIKTASTSLSVRDDELLPVYETANIVRNAGDRIVVPIRNVVTREYPVTISVSIDQENTTADPSDYLLEPANGLVTIDAGELESSYTITLNNTVEPDIASTLKDKKITVVTDIDEIVEVDPYTIEINQWPLLNAPENEIISSDAGNEEAVSFAVDNDGIVTTLLAYTGSNNIKTRLKAFYRDASEFPFTDQSPTVELGKAGLDVAPVAIESFSETSKHSLYVIVNVNGLYGDVFRGGVDFAVLYYTREPGKSFTLNSVKQYGTDGDDIVSGAVVRNDILYVFGKTNGQNFEGQPTDETNKGGDDGFIYAINAQNNTFSWSRFVGTSDNDIVKDLDAGSRDIVALVSTENTDQDAFIRKLSARSSLDQPETNSVNFNSSRDDIAVGVRFDATANRYRALLNSSALLSETNATTPTLSVDAQLMTFDSENLSTGELFISTAGDDFAVSFENMPDKQHFIIAGNTNGRFENNQRKGTSGFDAFVSIFNSKNQSAGSLVNDIQFGTLNDDQVIKVRPVSNTKFLVLWKENFTQNPSYVYRISAFSVDGRKLSRDPD